MRGSRFGIAAQAIGVLALIAIVYAAFLRPDDSGPLTGIEIEDGTGIEAFPFAGGERRSDRSGPSDRPERAARGSTDPADVTVSELDLEPGDSPAADTPGGSQYSDAVARILDQVARARP